MALTFKEIHFWYKIYERQIAEEVIVNEYTKNDKPLPNNIERQIEKKLKEWHGEV